MSDERQAKLARVVEAAKIVVHWGPHCTGGYHGDCEHCLAEDELGAAVKDLDPADAQVVVK